MTITSDVTAAFVLDRHRDPSGVSGTGVVAWGAEFPDGAVALRWPGEHPSTATWEDIRDVEAIHGHEGLTEISYLDGARLLRAYQTVTPVLLRMKAKPVTVQPHPDHPDRLRVTFASAADWAAWVEALAGFPAAVHAAVHEEVAGEVEHRWTTPHGDIWCVYYSPLADEPDPLQQYDEEDR